ncbi:MAG: ribulose-phosphate 3-epimerase [Clostridia bacterium]|nr:ribulose-phosphate 3-epimerase [Clostridia bacterium]
MAQDKREFKLAPSILSSDFSILGQQIKEAEKGGAKVLHIDVMDGRFVPNFTFGALLVKTIRKCSDMFYDCHLMVERPYDFIDAFYKAGADNITVHYEALGDETGKALEYIRSLGIKAGLSISPDTPVEVIAPYKDKVDMVLIMSVYPGFGGQKFIPKSLERIAAVREMTKDYDVDIEVDGGVYDENIKTVVDAGANVIVAGSAVFGKENIAQAAKALIEAATNE